MKRSILRLITISILLIGSNMRLSAQNSSDTTYIYFDYYNNPYNDFNKNLGWIKNIDKKIKEPTFFSYDVRAGQSHYLYIEGKGMEIDSCMVGNIKLQSIDDLAKVIKGKPYTFATDFTKDYYPILYVVERTKKKKYLLYKISRWEFFRSINI